jgi:hypothetical protein
MIQRSTPMMQPGTHDPVEPESDLLQHSTAQLLLDGTELAQPLSSINQRRHELHSKTAAMWGAGGSGKGGWEGDTGGVRHVQVGLLTRMM